MSGVLNALLGMAAGLSVNSFNITAASTGTGAGYSDGSGGTSTGIAVGSITGGTLTGGKIVCEVSFFPTLTQQRFRVRGFTLDPGQGWLKTITVNSETVTPAANLTYTWDATHGTASWVWATGHGADWNLVNTNTYNGNSVTHN